MKACKDIQDRLAAFLDGELPAEEAGRIAQHVASCQQCEKALAELKKTVELVKHLDEVEPPPFFTQRIMAHVREEEEKSRVKGHGSWVTGIVSKLFYPLHVKIPVQALALVLVVGLVFLVYRSMEPEMKFSSTPTETIAPTPKDEVGREPKEAIPAIEAPRKEAPLKGQADTRESVRKEEAKVSTRPDREKAVEKKSDVLAEKPSQEPEVAFAPAPKEVAEPQKAPAATPPPTQARQATQAREAGEAGQTAEVEALGGAGRAARDKMDRALAPPAREYRAAAKGVEPIEFVIQATDVHSAAQEVERLLNRLGADEIKRDPRETGVAISGVVQNRKLPELVERLRSLGELRNVPAYPSTAQGTSGITIRIEP